MAAMLRTDEVLFYVKEVGRLMCRDCNLVFGDENSLLVHNDQMHIRRKKWVLLMFLVLLSACVFLKSIAPGFFLLRIRLILRYICKWCGHVAHTMTELNLHKADVHAMPPFTAKSDRDRVSWNLLILL